MTDPLWGPLETEQTVDWTLDGALTSSASGSEVAVVHPGDVSLPTLAQRLIRHNYYDALGGPASDEILRGPRHRNVTRRIYNLVRSWWYYLGLTGEHTRAWYPGWLAGGDGYINYTLTYGYSASGSGTSITISWAARGASNDPRALSHWPNWSDSGVEYLGPGNGYWNNGEQVYPQDLHYAATSLEVGSLVLDERNGWAGAATLLDWKQTSDTSALLYLDRPLANPIFQVWVFREQVLPALPVMPLWPSPVERTSPMWCRWATQTDRQCVASLANAAPTLPASTAIYATYDGATLTDCWYCAKADQVNVDFSLFRTHQGKCRNTACPYYEALTFAHCTTPDGWTWQQLMGYLIASPGVYTRQPPNMAGGLSLTLGRNGWTGPLASAGAMGQNYYQRDLGLASQRFDANGIIRRKNGTLASGFARLENVDEAVGRYLEGGAAPNNDRNGLLEEIARVASLAPLSRRSQSGGASPTDRGLVALEPGASWLSIVNVDRPPSVECGEGDKTPATAPYTQRVRPRVCVSSTIALPATRVDAQGVDEFSYRGTTYRNTAWRTWATPQSSFGGAFSYDLVFAIPRFGENASAPTTRYEKAVDAANVYQVPQDGPTWWIEFEIGSDTAAYRGLDLSYLTWPISLGGNVVGGPLWQRNNSPAAARRYGDPERLLYPGDTIQFADADDNLLPPVIVTYAKAFGGQDWQLPDATEITTPTGQPLGCGALQMPFTPFGLGDRIEVAVRCAEMSEAEFIAALQAGGCKIHKVWHGAVAPVAAEYAPAFSAINLDTEAVVELVDGTDYKWDPATGKCYLNSSAWAAGNWRVRLDGYTFDCRQVMRYSDVDALEAIFEGVAEGYAGGGSIGSSFGAIRMGYANGIGSNWVPDFLNVDGFGNIVPGNYSYSNPSNIFCDSGGSIKPSGSAIYGSEPVLFYPDTGSSYRIGCVIVPPTTPFYINPSRISIVSGYFAPIYRINPPQVPSACISSALVDVTVSAGQKHRYYYGDTPPSGSNVTNIDTATIGIVYVSLNENGSLNVSNVGGGSASSMVTTLEGGVYVTRGTMDITAGLRMAADIAATGNDTDGFFALMLLGPVAFPEDASNALGFLKTFTESWEFSGEYSSGTGEFVNTAADVLTYEFTYNGISFGSIRVKYDWSTVQAAAPAPPIRINWLADVAATNNTIIQAGTPPGYALEFDSWQDVLDFIEAAVSVRVLYTAESSTEIAGALLTGDKWAALVPPDGDTPGTASAVQLPLFEIEFIPATITKVQFLDGSANVLREVTIAGDGTDEILFSKYSITEGTFVNIQFNDIVLQGA